ncbi:MAG: Uma2 family endonuclease [Leptolyngbyaceae cyanobacterium RM1_406_9]|nr:Uma2 family endonuclease [Leptolyngbyaceae cyanobacterium RM1_406_9]
MTSTVVTAKWTLDDYHRMIEAGILCDRRVELLDGEIVEMSPEGTPHAHLSSTAADYIRGLLRGKAAIREAKPVTLLSNSEPEPDIAIVQDLDEEYFDHHPYPENIFWIVEFSNTSLTKDLEIKSKVYARAGIREYWVVNLKRMELIIFRDPIEDEYREKRTLTSGEISPVAFPEVSITVGRFIKR